MQATPSGYDHAYGPDFAYESRPTGYRERVGRYNPESYGPPNVYSSSADSRWSHSSLPQSDNAIPIPIPISAPSRNQSRSNLMNEFPRPPAHFSDMKGPSWTPERRYRHDSFSSSYAPGQDFRLQGSAAGSALASPTRYPSTVSKFPRHTRELSNEDIALREAAYSDTSKRLVSDSRSKYCELLRDPASVYVAEL